MKPDSRFRKQPKRFWASVRAISQHAGYTQRGQRQIKVPSLGEMRRTFEQLGLDTGLIANDAEEPTEFGAKLSSYFRYRAGVLNAFVEPRLMDVGRAKTVFKELHDRIRPTFQYH